MKYVKAMKMLNDALEIEDEMEKRIALTKITYKLKEKTYRCNARYDGKRCGRQATVPYVFGSHFCGRCMTEQQDDVLKGASWTGSLDAAVEAVKECIRTYASYR